MTDRINVYDLLSGEPQFFDEGETVTRLRAESKIDRYSKKQTAADWANADRLDIENVFWNASGSSTSIDGLRETSQGTVLMTVPDPDADIRDTDRIERGGVVWKVIGFPADDRNPFDGWQPTLVVQLERVKG